MYRKCAEKECNCQYSPHGSPRVTTLGETLTGLCSVCGHPALGVSVYETTIQGEN